MRGVDMTKAVAIKQTNPQNAVKRVYVDPSELKRSASGSGFTRCEKCEKDIAVARVDSHDCEQEAKTKALVTKMKDQAVKKSDDSTKGTKRKTEPKAVTKPAKVAKQAKKAKGKDPNAPKRPASGFLIFMETFRKTFKDANPEVKGVAAAAKAGGAKWKEMSEEEKAVYNKDAEARKATYEMAVAKYKNKDSSKDDGEVSEAAAEDEEEEADVEDE